MFGLVTQRKYNTLDKKFVSTQKELDDIRKYCVCVRKQDMDVLMSDIKKLETDNEILRKQVEKYQDIMEKIFRLTESVDFNTEEISKGVDTEAYWVTEEGKPLVCSKCGHSFWNGTDHYVTHCSGCGRRMIDIVKGKIITEEK